jgi:hypothetical protein
MQGQRSFHHVILMTIVLSFFSITAFADTGVPMLALMWPVFWLALLPIIGIEFFVLKRKLHDVTSKRLLLAASLSNIVSTFIGIPLTWGCLVGLQFLGMSAPYIELDRYWLKILNATLGAAWLAPYESDLYWMMPTAAIVLLIPFFFVSYWIEAAVTVWIIKDTQQKLAIKKAVWTGNIYSYSLLFLLALGYLAYCLLWKFNK